MSENTDQSPAIDFILKCWEHATRESWTKLNSAMYQSTSIAIMADMRFEPDDFKVLAQKTRSHYWITQSGEGLYMLACGSAHGSANSSAAIAMETSYFGRPAFLWSEDGSTPTRLYVGAHIKWDGRHCEITSISGDSFIACSYKKSNKYSRKVDKRYTITHAAMMEERKVRKNTAKSKKQEKEAAK